MNKKLKKWHICDGTEGTPNLIGRFLEGTIDNPKIFNEAGLPNIWGRTSMLGGPGPSGGGTFYYVYNLGTHYFGSGGYTADRAMIGFDASRYNPIYGRSSTVQPSSYTVFYIMKIKK